jgi:DNA-binding GntR family transcriptional regulator
MQRLDLRTNLAEEVANAVRGMILDGRLPAGQRINEVRLAAELGVSRTPLREALSRLINEGALKGEARRGLFVKPLTAEEVRAIYPIRAILDPAALRLAGIPGPDTLAAMRACNAQLASASDPGEAVQLDDQFHLQLVAGCPNPVLIDLIRQFMWRTRRYELGLMGRQAPMSAAVATHDRILDALESGDLELAARELEANMSRGAQPILDWLAECDRDKAGE